MEFYGMILKGSESKKLDAPENCLVVIQNIALSGCEDGKSNVVSIKVGEATQVLCTLIAGRVPQYSLELAVDPADESAELISKGDGEVHVTGMITLQEDEDMMDDFDEEDTDEEGMEDMEGEEEDEEEEDEGAMEDEEEAAPAPEPEKKKKKPAAAAPAAKKPETPAAKKPEAPAKKDTPKKPEAPAAAPKKDTPKKESPKKPEAKKDTPKKK